MPYMIRMSVERLNGATLRLSNTFVYLRFETSQSRRLFATKRRENKGTQGIGERNSP